MLGNLPAGRSFVLASPGKQVQFAAHPCFDDLPRPPVRHHAQKAGPSRPNFTLREDLLLARRAVGRASSAHESCRRHRSPAAPGSVLVAPGSAAAVVACHRSSFPAVRNATSDASDVSSAGSLRNRRGAVVPAGNRPKDGSMHGHWRMERLVRSRRRAAGRGFSVVPVQRVCR